MRGEGECDAAYVLRHLDANDELLRLSPSRQALRDSREGTIVEFLIFDDTDDLL